MEPHSLFCWGETEAGPRRGNIPGGIPGTGDVAVTWDPSLLAVTILVSRPCPHVLLGATGGGQEEPPPQ